MSDPSRHPPGPLMATYPAPPVTFVRGQGTRLFDAEGRSYLDFVSGLAVTSLGHAHPRVSEALAAQASTLLHVSNLYGNTLGPELGARLDRLIGGQRRGQLFFCNSGAEANECAIKLARKWGNGRHVVVSALNSFHGRTLATLHATGQPEKHRPFQPLPQGFVHVPYGDAGALEARLGDPAVAAVLLEVIQGETGVNMAPAGYLERVQDMCRRHDRLLMIDEVQTGLGRTGRWFAFQHFGLEPDVVTLAKALGNGFPIGACWARAEVAAAFVPGDHGTTFGGQPLAAAAALAVLDVMEEEDTPARAEKMGMRLHDSIVALHGVVGVRGRGLLLAAELAAPVSRQVASVALERGLVVNPVTPTALRLAPPLLVSDSEIDEAVSILEAALVSAAQASG